MSTRYNDAYWKKQFVELLESANKRHNGEIEIKAKSKRPKLWKTLNILLKIVTLGMSANIYETYITIWGRKIYVGGDGSSFNAQPAVVQFGTLRHELEHLDWFYFGEVDAQENPDKEYKTSNVLVRGWRKFLYLVWPFPFFFATYRQNVEKYGYKQQVRREVLLNAGRCPIDFQVWVREQFTGPTYGWMATGKKAQSIVEEIVYDAQNEYRDKVLKKRLFGPNSTE